MELPLPRSPGYVQAISASWKGSPQCSQVFSGIQLEYPQVSQIFIDCFGGIGATLHRRGSRLAEVGSACFKPPIDLAWPFANFF